jgi:uncharacterized membrane protein YukC
MKMHAFIYYEEIIKMPHDITRRIDQPTDTIIIGRKRSRYQGVDSVRKVLRKHRGKPISARKIIKLSGVNPDAIYEILSCFNIIQSFDPSAGHHKFMEHMPTDTKTDRPFKFTRIK